MKKIACTMMAIATLLSCSTQKADTDKDDFNYSVERFADLEVLRYKVPGFEDLSLKQKELVYYLTEAALNGRDILFDQQGKLNLAIRRTLESVYQNYTGDKNDRNLKLWKFI